MPLNTRTVSGTVASFSDSIGLPLVDCTVFIDPVQSGTGDPSPTNVRPISGWTGCNVYRAEKNLFIMPPLSELKTYNTDGTWNDNVYSIDGLTYTFNQDSGGNIVSIKINGTSTGTFGVTFSERTRKTLDNYGLIIGTSYLFSSGTSNQDIQLILNGARANIDSSETGSLFIASSSDSYFPNIRPFLNRTFSNVMVYPMIRLSSIADATFVPYYGNGTTTFPISWQSSAGTVYGGELDVATGVLTATMASVDLGTLEWSSLSTSIGAFYTQGISDVIVPETDSEKVRAASSHYRIFPYNNWTNDFSISYSTQQNLVVHDSTYSGVTASQFKTAMSGVQLVYELATPLEYTLTAQQLTTLLGENNIWADTGNISATYVRQGMSINKIDTDGYWMVNSNHIYIPSTPCKVEHSNVVGSDSGRDESGLMHIDWIRRDVRKVFLTYNAISESELLYIMDLMQGQEFQFKFLDKGTVQTMNAYVGESNYKYYSYSDLYSEGVYVEFSMNVIEL